MMNPDRKFVLGVIAQVAVFWGVSLSGVATGGTAQAFADGAAQASSVVGFFLLAQRLWMR